MYTMKIIPPRTRHIFLNRNGGKFPTRLDWEIYINAKAARDVREFNESRHDPFSEFSEGEFE